MWVSCVVHFRFSLDRFAFRPYHSDFMLDSFWIPLGLLWLHLSCCWVCLGFIFGPSEVHVGFVLCAFCVHFEFMSGCILGSHLFHVEVVSYESGIRLRSLGMHGGLMKG